MSGELELVLVRHGETEWSASGFHTGKTDLALTETGELAAAALRGSLVVSEPFAAISSPLQRARQTAYLAGFGEHLEFDEGLLEWDYGDYEGVTSAAIRATRPTWDLFTDGCPGGESPAAVTRRVDRVIARLSGRTELAAIVVFAHGHILRVLGARWIGLDITAARSFELDTAHRSVLSADRGVRVIKEWNASS